MQATGSPTSYALATLPAGLSFNSSTGLVSGMPTAAGTYALAVSATNATGTGQGTVDLVIAASVSTPPVITSAAQAVALIKEPFYYFITTDVGATSYTAMNLPSGLSLNTATGLISGTLASVGNTSVTISATNAVGTTQAEVTISVVAPSFVVPTNPAAVSGVRGQTFSTTLGASVAAYSYSASPLPAGLSINASTGVISGTPTAVGNTSVTTFQYTNSGSVSGKLFISIGSTAPTAPVISSSAGLGAYIGLPVAFYLQASNSPTSFSAYSLPPGLTLNTSTGLISGTPVTAGTFAVTVTASNSQGPSGAAVMMIYVTYPQGSLTSISSAAEVPGVEGCSFGYSLTSYTSILTMSLRPTCHLG